MTNARLSLDGREVTLPVVVGTEAEHGIDISNLRSETGAITLDLGYGNTGACKSAITYIDGEKGILRYCGYPIEQLAEHTQFTEVAYLLINGDLPNRQQYTEFRDKLTYHSLIHEDMKKFYEGFPPGAHPMAILSSMIASMSTYYPNGGADAEDLNIIRVLAKAKTIAAYSYKKSVGQPFIYPRNDLPYCGNFLHMMFAFPTEPYIVPKVAENALNKLLILHADHEQNCSTSTVRLVGSSQANLFASLSAGICALWGPLHGGANQAVIEMLEMIQADTAGNYKKYVDLAKDKNSNFRLMGFGHRVYKNFDPRATILKKATDDVLNQMGVKDPLLDIAKELGRGRPERRLLRRAASSIPTSISTAASSTRAIGIPTNMLYGDVRPGTVARLDRPLERAAAGQCRIGRPRQIYVKLKERPLVPLEVR